MVDDCVVLVGNGYENTRSALMACSEPRATMAEIAEYCSLSEVCLEESVTLYVESFMIE